MNSDIYHQSIDGLKNGITVNEEDEIRMAITQDNIDVGTILIGCMEDLYKQEPYKDGTYTDENGIVIHLETLIDNMSVSDTTARNIKSAKREKESPDAIFTQRMHRFHGALYNNLRCRIE